METPKTPQTFADIVNLWPSAEALAADLGKKGVTVRQWRNRGWIPAEEHLTVVRAAQARAENDAKFRVVTADLLMRIASSGRPDKKKAA